MAKRSDFALKLLDDLRVRKEQMAAANQSSSRSNTASNQSSSRSSTAARDAQRYSRQTFKGSKEMVTHNSIGSKIDNRHRMSGNSKRSFVLDSKQIVPFGSGQSMEHIGDLPMALAFALENVGKFRRLDSPGSNSMLCLQQQFGRGSANLGILERKGSLDRQWFPTLSDIQINQISKGAQKLNQILKACSNGIIFDRYSVEFGKELFKGAIDLEESLRMLVSLQEASEYMVKPQRKSRIRLLEGEEDDDEDMSIVADQRQLARPRFSFDKPSKISQGNQEIPRNGLRIGTSQASKSTSHRHSASYGPELHSITTLYEEKKQQSLETKPARKGIPSVIAKLMGLEEVPEHMESSNSVPKESSSLQEKEVKVMKKTSKLQTNNAESKNKETVSIQPQKIKQKLLQAGNEPINHGTTSMLQAEKHKLRSNSSILMMIYDRKPPWRDTEYVKGKNSAAAPSRTATEMRSQRDKLIQSDQIVTSQVEIQKKERTQKYAKNSKGKGKDLLTAEANVPAPNEDQGVIILQKHQSPGDKRNPQKYLGMGLQEKNAYKRSEPHVNKDQADKKEQQNVKQKLQQVRKHRGTGEVSKTPSDPKHGIKNPLKKSPDIIQTSNIKKLCPEATDAIPARASLVIINHENHVEDKRSTNGNLEQSDSSKDFEAEFEKAKVSTLQVIKKKPFQTSHLEKKLDKIILRKYATPRKIDEVMTRKNASVRNLATAIKNQTSTLQETKHRMNEKISRFKEAAQVNVNRTVEAEVHIIRSTNSEANMEPLNVIEHLQKVDEKPTEFHNLEGEFCPNRGKPETPGSVDRCQDRILQAPDKVLGHALVFGKDYELKPRETESGPDNSLTGKHDDTFEISYVPPVQKVCKSRTHEPLTEKEFQLKQILVLNQLFLNTAEALFKLNIPVGILNGGDQNCQDEDIKLMLDCGYEIIKRKGTTQELSIHPLMKMSICNVKVKSLDDLVKQLHKDLEKLKCYSDESESVAYLLNMVEKDIQHKDPDVNCMWDFGWSDPTFAFMERDDVIRDVEKYVLNGLIDEIARDFLYL